MDDPRPPDYYEKRSAELQKNIEEATEEIRKCILLLGLEGALRHTFTYFDDCGYDEITQNFVDSELKRVMEIYQHPEEGYRHIRNLSVEQQAKRVAEYRHVGAKQRMKTVRSEWIDKAAEYGYNKTKFAEETSEKHGVEFKTVYYRWLKGL